MAGRKVGKSLIPRRYKHGGVRTVKQMRVPAASLSHTLAKTSLSAPISYLIAQRKHEPLKDNQILSEVTLVTT